MEKLVQKPPISKRTKLLEEDLRYLFIDINLCDEEIADFYNKTTVTVGKFRKLYNITKSKELVEQCKQRRSLQKYGVKSPAQLKETRDKYRQTCLERYGTDNVFSSDIGKEKIKQGNLKKYGVEHNHQCKDVINKMKNTFLERYGYECSLSNPEVHQKAEETWIKTLGVNNPGKSNVVRDKMKQTNLEKFGVEYASQNEEVKQKLLENMDIKLQKSYNTKRKNNSFNTSNGEKQIQKLLESKFTVICQYKCEEYPFCCDFYLPELQLFIEYNGCWTHGGRPYGSDCTKQLDKWKEKAKSSKYYKNAIYTWTDLDVRKRKVAKENNLNWVEFFTMEQFMDWFNNLW